MSRRVSCDRGRRPNAVRARVALSRRPLPSPSLPSPAATPRATQRRCPIRMRSRRRMTGHRQTTSPSHRRPSRRRAERAAAASGGPRGRAATDLRGGGQRQDARHRLPHRKPRRVPPRAALPHPRVTFTNKAAGEMQEPPDGLLGDGIAKDLLGRHLSLGLRAASAPLLRGRGARAQLRDLRRSDQRTVINRVIKELDLDDKRFPPRQVLSRIHAAKQEGQTSADVAKQPGIGATIAGCFDAYERHLKNANAVDFDDLLLAVLRLVEDADESAGSRAARPFSPCARRRVSGR